MEVHVARPVWLPNAFGLLDEIERDRLQHLRRPVDRASYLTRHALARIVLGRHLGLDPARLRFTRDCLSCDKPHGKPRLVQDSSSGPLSFNLSGATARPSARPADSLIGGLEAVAVLTAIRGGSAETRPGGLDRREHEIGVDVEGTDATRFDGFEDVALHADERTALAALPASVRELVCAAWWARKEAVVKALGDGLRIEPATIATTPLAIPEIDAPPRLLHPERWPRMAIADLGSLDAVADGRAEESPREDTAEITASRAENVARDTVGKADKASAPNHPGTVIGAVCVLGVGQVRAIVRPGYPLLAAYGPPNSTPA